MPRVKTIRPLLAAGAIACAALLSACVERHPKVDLHVAPSYHVQPGTRVTFADTAYDADIYQWDLDGDGMFETDTGTTASVSKQYMSPGVHNISLNATKTRDGPQSASGYAFPLSTFASTLVVVDPPPTGPNQPPANQSPTASFTTDASPGYTERAVHFDASASSDPDGTVVKYEWDFDSDGTYDATGATASHAYNLAGTYQATLRVTDDKGATATTQRAVPVQDGIPPGKQIARAGAAMTAARGGTPFTTSLTFKVVKPGRSFVNGGTLFQAGFTARGRMKLAHLTKPLDRKRAARWAASLAVKQHGSSAATKIVVEGYILLDFGHGDRLCLSGSGSGSATSAATGRLAVVGGSGLAGHLRGAATFAVPPDAKQVNGRLTLAKTRKASKLPKACTSLVRTLR